MSDAVPAERPWTLPTEAETEAEASDESSSDQEQREQTLRISAQLIALSAYYDIHTQVVSTNVLPRGPLCLHKPINTKKCFKKTASNPSDSVLFSKKKPICIFCF